MSPSAPPDAPLSAWLQIQEELAQLLAHDMRNPLQAILANASFLDDSFRPSEQETRETAGDIRSSAEVLLRLIDNMVAVARLETTVGVVLPRSPLSLLAVTETAMERCASSAASSEIALSLESSENARVLADVALLELMVQNMILNAVQHTRRRGSVTVRLERRDDRAAVTVLDAGPAWGPYERHFTREAQVAIKFQTDGRYSRGLGLYVIGLVSEAFGGTIETGREGARSSLRVWLPVSH